MGKIPKANNPKIPKMANPATVMRPKQVPDTAKVDHVKHAIVFNFSLLDLDAPFAEQAGMTSAHMPDLFKHLKEFSAKTWDALGKELFGSRNRKTKHHFIDVSSLTPTAQKRFNDLFDGDADEKFYSLRHGGKWRLFGLRIEGVFFAMWWDVTHEQICESKGANN